jgi:hypothetical protein
LELERHTTSVGTANDVEAFLTAVEAHSQATAASGGAPGHNAARVILGDHRALFA